MVDFLGVLFWCFVLFICGVTCLVLVWLLFLFFSDTCVGDFSWLLVWYLSGTCLGDLSWLLVWLLVWYLLGYCFGTRLVVVCVSCLVFLCGTSMVLVWLSSPGYVLLSFFCYVSIFLLTSLSCSAMMSLVY